MPDLKRRGRLRKPRTDRFFMLPESVYASTQFLQLNGSALHALMLAGHGHFGDNNGAIAFGRARIQRHLRTRNNQRADDAARALFKSGLLVETRIGRRGIERLVALAWLPLGTRAEMSAYKTGAPLDCAQYRLFIYEPD